MGENSKIEWTTHTFNPWIGCTKVSPGCANCYAERDMQRYGKATWGAGQPRVRTAASTWAQPLKWDRAAAKAGRRDRVFCASLADVFDPEVPIEWLDNLFALIDACQHLDWLLLTKRPELIMRRVGAVFERHLDGGGRGPDFASCWIGGMPPPNVWLGTTIEDQQHANTRIPWLLKVPARVHFLSCEPLLGPVDLSPAWCDECGGFEAVAGSDGATPFCPHCPGMSGDGNEMCHLGWLDSATPPGGMIDWIICGGESGPNARPINQQWARSLRDQAQAAGVPFLFKQWGEWLPGTQYDAAHRAADPAIESSRFDILDWEDGEFVPAADPWDTADDAVYRVGKKRAGRRLDGRTWDEVPSP